MSIIITPETKHTLALTNDAKGPNTTWDEANYTWDEAVGTWNRPGVVIVLDTKSEITISPEAKH